MLRGVVRVVRTPHALREADVIIARNFDLLFIAWASRLLLGRRATPLVYECLDIHGLFTRPGLLGRAMRWSERRLLARVQLLIVSSPGFVDNYFQPLQNYTGPVSLIENKLWFDAEPPARKSPKSVRPRPDDTLLTLGWVGSIRCADSLEILTRAAQEMAPDLQIAIHGNIHRHVLPDFDQQIADLANVTYHGPYSYPDDLAAIYASCDLVWAQDLWQRGGNSDWLLPNRIYEASWFGCPSVAVAGTETGRRVESAGLGITLGSATAQDLVEALRRLTPENIADYSRAILAVDAQEFRQSREDIARALEPVLPL